MREFRGTDFRITGNDIRFGPGYSNYGAIQLQHVESGARIDIVVDSKGKKLGSADAVTDSLRSGFRVGDDHLKIVPIMIDGQQRLVVKWPEIIIHF